MPHRRHDATSATRALCGLSVAVPALAMGGVHPPVVAVTGLLVVGWVLSLRRAVARWPVGLTPALALAAFTTLQALPMPVEAVRALAPLGHVEAAALWPDGPEGLAAPTWASISIFPAATALEAARWLILAGLMWAAAQTPWRVVARAVAFTAFAVALVGLVQLALGSEAIWGVYHPKTRPSTAALLTTFINPNHQAALFSLGLFSSAALYLDRLEYSERNDTVAIAWAAGVAACFLGLLLSLSRGALAAAVVALALGLVRAFRRGSGPRRAAWLAPGLLVLGASLLAIAALSFPRLSARLSPLWQSAGAGAKYETAARALHIVPGAPWLGSGRGTSIDLLPLVGLDGLPVTTHVEVAPVTAIVEWGPLVGAAALVAAAMCLVRMLRARRGAQGVLALGLVAFCVHNLADFNWEYLGSTSAAAALFGTLTPRRRKTPKRPWPSVMAAAIGGSALALALAPVSDPLAPHAMPSLERARRWRPLDPRVHLELARRALASTSAGDGSRAEDHARAAERLRKSVDAPLLLAELAARRGELDAFSGAVQRAWLRATPKQRRALVAWLIPRAREGADVGLRFALADAPPQPLDEFLAVARQIDPQWSLALAEARLLFEPMDPAALAETSLAALRAKDPQRAAESAARWRRAAPRSGRALATWAEARVAANPDALPEALEALSQDLTEFEGGSFLLEARTRLHLRYPGPDPLRELRRDRSLILEQMAEPTARSPRDLEATRRRLRRLLGRVDERMRMLEGPPAPQGPLP